MFVGLQSAHATLQGVFVCHQSAHATLQGAFVGHQSAHATLQGVFVGHQSAHFNNTSEALAKSKNRLKKHLQLDDKTDLDWFVWQQGLNQH